jgi:putative phage-type endonuclease
MEKMEQRTEAWLQARVGKLTASRCDDALATTKTGESAYRRNLRLQILAERLTGIATVIPETPAMRWGTENEGVARLKFASVTGLQVEEDGFIEHPILKGFGCSPDGLTSDGGLVEIKCPQGPKHIENFLSEKIPKEYIAQLLAQLSCTGRKFVYWCSFHPMFPESSQIKIIKFQPSEEELNEFESRIYEFLEEVNEMERKIRGA